MNFRFGVASLLALAVVAGSCASPGPQESPEGMTAMGWDEDDLPSWVEELPEGDPPRDNEHTQGAMILLLQAAQTDDEASRRELYEEALEAARGGIEEDPGNAQSYFQAGEALLGLERYEEAGEMLDRAEEIYPRYVLETEVLREQAWIQLYNAGVEHVPDQMDQALPYFERAHSVYQGRPEAMLQVAGVYTQQGRSEEALELFAEAVEVIQGPRSEQVEDEELLAVWAESLEIALFNKAQILFELERYGEAAEVYEDILANTPDDLLAMSNLAISLVASGQEDRAMEVYDQLLARPDLDARDYFMIGVGFYQADEFEQAARAFQASHEMVPQNREALFNFAQSLYLDDAWEELEGVARDLIEVDTHNRNAYRFLAQSLVQLDDQQAAVQVLEEMQALPFDLDAMRIEPFQGGVAVVGQITNWNLPAGTDARLRIYFYDLNGGEVGTEDVTVEVGEVEEPVAFQVDHSTNADVIGYRYEVMN